MKSHLLSWSLLLLTVTAHAQSDKTTVGILPFSYVNMPEVIQRVETINELVESAFVKANRKTIVSRMNFTDLKDEVDRNKGTEFIDGKAGAWCASRCGMSLSSINSTSKPYGIYRWRITAADPMCG